MGGISQQADKAEGLGGMPPQGMRQQTTHFLSAIGLKIGDRLIVSQDQTRYFNCIVTPDGFSIESKFKKWNIAANRWAVYKEKLGKENWEWRFVPLNITDGWNYFYKQAKRGAQIFYKANRLEGGLGNDAFMESWDLFAEDDERKLDEQRENIAWAEQRLKFRFTLVHSGGKSFHCHAPTTRAMAKEEWLRINSKLCAFLGGDFAVNTLHRQVRLAGFPRKGKDGVMRAQSLEAVGDRVDPDKFEAALDAAWPHPYPWTQERWDKYKSVATTLNNPQLDDSKVLPCKTPADAFRLPGDVLFPKAKQRSSVELPGVKKQRRHSSNYSSSSDNPWGRFLDDVLTPALEMLPIEQQFNLGGEDHQWQSDGNGIAGRSPWSSKNSSGTTLKVDSDGAWYCHASETGTQSAKQYLQLLWYRCMGGDLSGRQFVEFCRRLAGELGIEIPGGLERSSTSVGTKKNLTEVLDRKHQAWIRAVEQQFGIQLPNTLATARKELEAYLRGQQQLPQDESIAGDMPQLQLPRKGRKAYFLDGQKATKKTSISANSVVQQSLRQGLQVVVCVPTRLLILDVAQTFRKHYTGSESKNDVITTTAEYIARNEKRRSKAKVVITCPESLWLLSDFSARVFILDEANEVVRRVEAGDLGKTPEIKAKNLSQLKRRLGSQTVVAATDQLYRCTIDAVMRLGNFAPSEAETIQRRRVQNDAEITLYVQNAAAPERWDGTKNKGRTNYSLMAWLRDLVDRLSAGDRVVIPCGSQEAARKIDMLLRRLFRGKRGHCIDGKYTPKKLKRHFAEDADEWIKANEPDWLIFTPVINSGVSIEAKYFDAQFEYISAFESATSASQRGERVRDVISREHLQQRCVYLGTQGLASLPSPEVFSDEYWHDLLAGAEQADAGSAGVAHTLGASSLIERYTEQQTVSLQDVQELPRYWAIEARETLLKQETLEAEWTSNGWTVNKGVPCSDRQIEAEWKIVSDSLTYKKARIQAKVESYIPDESESDEAENTRQHFAIIKGKQTELFGDFDMLSDPHWQAAWSTGSGATGAMDGIQTRACLDMAINQPEHWEQVRKLLALRTISNALSTTQQALPNLPISPRVIERTELLAGCPFVVELLQNPSTIYNKTTEGVAEAATYARENAHRFAVLSRHSQRIHGLQFTEGTPDIRCVSKLLQMAGATVQTAGRASGKYKYWLYKLAEPPEDVAAALEKLKLRPTRPERVDADEPSLTQFLDSYRIVTQQKTVSAAQTLIKESMPAVDDVERAWETMLGHLDNILGTSHSRSRTSVSTKEPITEVLDRPESGLHPHVAQWGDYILSQSSWGALAQQLGNHSPESVRALWTALDGHPALSHAQELHRESEALAHANRPIEVQLSDGRWVRGCKRQIVEGSFQHPLTGILGPRCQVWVNGQVLTTSADATREVVSAAIA